MNEVLAIADAQPDVDADKGAGAALIARFLQRLDDLIASTALKEGPLSLRIFKQSHRVRALRAGGNIGALTLDEAFKTLSEIEAEARKRRQSGEAA